MADQASCSSSLVGMIKFSQSKAAAEKKKKIVVLGSGWGAVNFLKHLKRDVFDVSIVSPSNYFLFTPFLPSVTVGTIEGRSTVEPVRKIIRKYHKNDAQFYEAECMKVDVEENKVFCKDTSGKIVDHETSKISLQQPFLDNTFKM